MPSQHNYILSEPHYMLQISRSVTRCTQASNWWANVTHVISFQSQYLWDCPLQQKCYNKNFLRFVKISSRMGQEVKCGVCSFCRTWICLFILFFLYAKKV